MTSSAAARRRPRPAPPVPPAADSERRGGSARATLGAALSSPLADYYLILGAATLLVGFGVTMVLSSSSVYAQIHGDSPYYFLIRQFAFLAAGSAAAWWLSRRHLGVLRIVGWAALFASFLLLLLTLAIGTVINGNKSWIVIPGVNVSLQASELAKFAIVVWGADILARKQQLLDQPRHLLFPFLPVSGLLVGLVLAQKDLGTALVMLLIIGAVLWVAGMSWRLIVLFGVGAVLTAVTFVLTSPERMGKITTFLNPTAGKEGANDQAISAMYALASGGWWGLGLSKSRQKWGGLPEAHTDYVFAIIGEELGLIGALVVVGLFLVLGWTGLRVAQRSSSAFARYAAAGCTLWFVIEASINIFVVLRLLPVLGVPLPFLSYGGSALLADLLALGVLLACARNEPEAHAYLTSPEPVTRPKLTTIVDNRG